MRSWKPLYF